MKGYLDDCGRLWIFRKNEFILVECRNDHDPLPCNHLCSRFGEPITSGTDTLLELCTRTLKFSGFEDYRE